MSPNFKKIFSHIGLMLLSLSNTIAYSASYYIDAVNGNDSYDGLAGEYVTGTNGPWKSIGKVNSSINSVSDKAYFICDGTWTGTQLVVDWGGATGAGNAALVDSYYMSGGSAVVGTDCGSLSKPVLQGAYNWPSSPLVGSVDTGAEPDSYYKGLLQVTKSFTDIRNIRVEYSSGDSFRSTGGNGTEISYVNFFQVESFRPAAKGIVLNYSDYSTIKHSLSTQCGHAAENGIGAGPNHPTCNTAVDSDFFVFENNTFYDMWGEGISAFKSYNGIITRNLVAGGKYVHIHIDKTSTAVVENNVIVGPENPDYLKWRSNTTAWGGDGITVIIEDTSPIRNATDILIRNNFIANTYHGFRADVQTNARGLGYLMSFKYVFNTCAGCFQPVGMKNLNAAEVQTSLIQNNLFIDTKSQVLCEIITDNDITLNYNHWDSNGVVNDASPTATVFDTDLTQSNNYWNNAIVKFTTGALAGQSQTVSGYNSTNGRLTTTAFSAAPVTGDKFLVIDADCLGTNDIIGSASLNYSGDWGLVTVGNIPEDSDKTPSPGSSSLLAATPLTTETLSNATLPEELTDSGSIDLTTASIDYLGVTRHVLTPGIGAISDSSTPATQISTFPFRNEFGAGADVVVDVTFTAENTSYCTQLGYIGVTANDILNTTTQDALYRTWRGYNGTFSCNYPVPDGNYDVRVKVAPENYHGVIKGACTSAGSFDEFGNPARTNDIRAEGVLLIDEFDNCKASGAPWSAYTMLLSNIPVNDGNLTLGFEKGDGSDSKFQISGIEIDIASSTPILNVGNATVSHTASNTFPNDINIDAIQFHQVTSTGTEPVIITGITDSTTCGVASTNEDSGSISYAATDINQTGDCGTISITFSDGENTDSNSVLTLSLSPISTGTISFTAQASNGTGRVKMTNQTGLKYWLINLSREIKPIYDTGESTDVNGVFEHTSSLVIPGDKYRVFIMIPGWSTFGADVTENRFYTREYVAQ